MRSCSYFHPHFYSVRDKYDARVAARRSALRSELKGFLTQAEDYLEAGLSIMTKGNNALPGGFRHAEVIGEYAHTKKTRKRC